MVMSIYRLLMLVAAIAYAASSVQVSIATLPVDGELNIPTGELASNIQVTLNGGEFSAISRIDGRFTFHDVPTGVYLLDVLSIHHVFSQMKIKVAAEEGVINVVEFKYPGAMRMQTNYPMKLRAIAPLSYFQPRPPFSVFSMMLGNPMMLIMVLMVGVIVFFPDVLKSLTENEDFKKGVEGQKGLQGDPMMQWKRAMGLESKADDDDE